MLLVTWASQHGQLLLPGQLGSLLGQTAGNTTYYITKQRHIFPPPVQPMEEARQGLLGKARRKRGVRYRGAHKSRGQGRWGTERFLSQG